MKRSMDRILTTHTGSLPRPDDLVQLMWAKEDGKPGVDCGFGTFVGSAPVDPEIAWVKLGSLVDGAKIASRELW